MAQIVATFLMPVPLVGLILLFALIALLLGRRRLGGSLGAMALALLLLFAWQPFAELLIKPLEQRYPPLLDAAEAPGAEYVLVLGAGHVPDQSVPASSRLDAMGLVRLAEGVRLHRAIADSTLVTSGRGTVTSAAQTAAELAQELGVERIKRLDTPRNTHAEAVAAAELMGDAPFILVTSASHMPRSMALFRAQGLDPIPAPTGHMAATRPPEDRMSVYYLRPSATGLRITERAFHEYLGLAWGRLQGIL